MDEPEKPEEMIIPDVSEALSFEPMKATVKPVRRWGRLLQVLILLTVGAGAAWYFLGGGYSGGFNGSLDNLPVIKASEGPVKVRPDNPGGMEVPDRDKLVYDRMEGKDEKPRIERLLPAPETPLPLPPTAPAPPPVPVAKVVGAPPQPPQAFTPPPKTPEPPSDAKKVEVEEAKEIASVKAQPPKVPTTTVPTTKDVLAATPPPPAPPPPQAVSKKAAPAPVTAAAVKDSNFFKVQLAAVRTPERARIEWERLSKQNFKLLGGLELFVTKVDLGPGKGIFYRLRAGPITTEAAARDTCDSLAKRKVGCLIVRPGG